MSKAETYWHASGSPSQERCRQAHEGERLRPGEVLFRDEVDQRPMDSSTRDLLRTEARRSPV